MEKDLGNRPELKKVGRMVVKCRKLPEVFSVVDEAEQREVFERMRGEGRRVRLLVL